MKKLNKIEKFKFRTEKQNKYAIKILNLRH